MSLQRWEAYKEVNKEFAFKLRDVYTPPNDLLWVHDYPLLLMPAYAVHHHVSPANMGFFLHTPFPSSEVCGPRANCCPAPRRPGAVFLLWFVPVVCPH